MNLHEMRNFISKAYPGQEWKNRVKKMGEAQIIAVYYNLVNRENPLLQKAAKIGLSEVAMTKDDEYVQLTIFDILKGENDDR